MNPAKQLNGAIALLTQPFAKNSQPIKVEIKQIGRHRICAAPGRPKRAVPPSAGSDTQWSVGAILSAVHIHARKEERDFHGGGFSSV